MKLVSFSFNGCPSCRFSLKTIFLMFTLFLFVSACATNLEVSEESHQRSRANTEAVLTNEVNMKFSASGFTTPALDSTKLTVNSEDPNFSTERIAASPDTVKQQVTRHKGESIIFPYYYVSKEYEKLVTVSLIIIACICIIPGLYVYILPKIAVGCASVCVVLSTLMGIVLFLLTVGWFFAPMLISDIVLEEVVVKESSKIDSGLIQHIYPNAAILTAIYSSFLSILATVILYNLKDICTTIVSILSRTFHSLASLSSRHVTKLSRQ